MLRQVSSFLQPRVKDRLRLIYIPHLKEHQRKALNRVSLQHHGSIFPVAEPFPPVDILVGEIYAAVECHFSVNNQNFAMIPVIIMRRNKGFYGGERLRPDAALFQQLPVICRECGNLKHPVIQHPDFHTVFYLLLKDLQDFSPHISLIYDEIFHKDKGFRFFQFRKQCGKFIFPERKICDLRLIKSRKASAVVQIGDKVICPGSGGRELFHNSLRLADSVFCHTDQLPDPVLDLSMPQIDPRKDQKRYSRNRQNGNYKHPGQLRRGIHAAVKQIDHAAKCYQNKHE